MMFAAASLRTSLGRALPTLVGVQVAVLLLASTPAVEAAKKSRRIAKQRRKLAKATAKEYGHWLMEPVPGLYEAIRTAKRPRSWFFEVEKGDFGGPKSSWLPGKDIDTQAFPLPKSGKLSKKQRKSERTPRYSVFSKYWKDGGHFQIPSLFRIGGAPQWIRVAGVPGVVDGRIPTIMYVLLDQMQRLDVAPGSLESLSFKKVINAPTRRAMDLLPHLYPDLSDNELARHTYLVKVAESVLIQNGHKVVSVEYPRASKPTITLNLAPLD